MAVFSQSLKFDLYEGHQAKALDVLTFMQYFVTCNGAAIDNLAS